MFILSFVLIFSAFLIICVETLVFVRFFFCIFYYLRWNFSFLLIVKLNGQQRLYDVNVKAIYGCIQAGAGHEHLKKLCCYLNMPKPMFSNNDQF